MTLIEAARLLELAPDATPAQVETRVKMLRARLEEKIAAAPAPDLKEKHRAALAKVNAAHELLVLAAELAASPRATSVSPTTEEAIPVAAAAPSVPPAPVPPAPVPDPAPARSPVASRPPVVAVPTRPTEQAAAPASRGGRNFVPVIALVLVVGLVGAGGWWFLKNRAASAARKEAEIAVYAGQAAEARTRWARLESEAAIAGRTLAELKRDSENTDSLDAPARAELQARLRAQGAFVEWCSSELAEHPAKTLLARLDALVAAKGGDNAAQIEIDLQSALEQAEKELGAQKSRLLALGRPLNLVSEPAGLSYTFTDAYGRTSKGTTPATVDAPWGQAQVTISPPGSQWVGLQRDFQVGRDTAGELKAVFASVPARISSSPDGLAYELTNAAGLSLRGVTPADLKDVPTGPATLRVSRPGSPTIEQFVEIKDAQPNAFAVEFPLGSLTLVSEPAGATVFSGEEALGVTPLTLRDLAPGEHRYNLRLKGYGAASLAGVVREGEIAGASVVLDPSPELEAGEPYRVPALGLELMPIPAGSFTMGSSSTDQEHNSDEAQHQVTISRSYWLGKYEVTQAEWRTVMGNEPSSFKGDRLPVEGVSWEEAISFCHKLTERERVAGRQPAGYEYTLPTEAQWEYACRAGSTASFGGTGSLNEMGWYKTNSESKTHEVGRKPANAWGLHDMHGNVWEWCSDWFAFYPAGSVTDPTGPLVGIGRVNRGGGWGSVAASCRSAFRFNSTPGERIQNLGFRLALSPAR